MYQTATQDDITNSMCSLNHTSLFMYIIVCSHWQNWSRKRNHY